MTAGISTSLLSVFSSDRRYTNMPAENCVLPQAIFSMWGTKPQAVYIERRKADAFRWEAWMTECAQDPAKLSLWGRRSRAWCQGFMLGLCALKIVKSELGWNSARNSCWFNIPLLPNYHSSYQYNQQQSWNCCSISWIIAECSYASGS